LSKLLAGDGGRRESIARSQGRTGADRRAPAPPRHPSLAGFAAPLHSLSQPFCESVTREYAKAYLRLFLDRFAAQIADVSEGLVPLLKRGLAVRLPFETVWDVAFANVRSAALAEEETSSREAIHIGAVAGQRLICGGLRAGFATALDGGSAIRVDRWLVPAAEHLEAEGDGNRVRLVFGRTEGGRTVLRRDAARRWRNEGAAALPMIHMDRNTCVLLSRELWQALDEGEQFEPAEISVAEAKAALQRAIALLRVHSPRYLRWVDRVLRGVMACKGSANHLRSGSDFNLPGIVQMSFPAPAAAHAEMLVHECSHLNYQILTRLGDVDDGSDETLYFSPVKQTGRRIDRIVLAYHAFANVMLFYGDCLATGIDDDGYCERNVEATIPQLATLDEALRTTRALTPLGRALYEPLAAALR
jgi:HEXXH motif-containing protein